MTYLNSIAIAFALQELTWPTLHTGDQSNVLALHPSRGSTGELTPYISVILAKFGMHQDDFLLKILPWEGRRKAPVHDSLLSLCQVQNRLWANTDDGVLSKSIWVIDGGGKERRGWPERLGFWGPLSGKPAVMGEQQASPRMAGAERAKKAMNFAHPLQCGLEFSFCLTQHGTCPDQFSSTPLKTIHQGWSTRLQVPLLFIDTRRRAVLKKRMFRLYCLWIMVFLKCKHIISNSTVIEKENKDYYPQHLLNATLFPLMLYVLRD